MQSIDNKNKMLDCLAQGAALITPNKRLSAKLLQDYFKQQGNRTTPKPYCMPYSQTLLRAFKELQFKTPKKNYPIVLNIAQCRHIWRNIIQSTTSVAFNEGLLEAVMEAWMHCQQWQIHLNHFSFKHTAQTAQFQEWWQCFTQQIKKLNALTEYDLVPYLLKELTSSLFPKTIFWVCFDEFNPEQLLLQEALDHLGYEQYQYDLNLKEQTTSPTLFQAMDSKEEYQQLFLWLKERIQQGDECIGVVVPQLQQEARHLHRLLLKHFEPSFFNLYLGKTLSAFLLVSHAMTWLRLDKEQLSTHEAALLLQSPYLASAKMEFLERSQCLQDSSLLQQEYIPWDVFCCELKTCAPELSRRLQALKPFPSEAFVHEWVVLFQERLNALGFPGELVVHSEQHQCFNRFSTILDEFRQLGLITPSLNKEDALTALTVLLNKTIFQEKKAKAPIQIFGFLEASGHDFDSLWVMGLSAQQLPNKTKLSPFIAPQLQVQLQMPHSTSARELLFASLRLQRFQRSSLNTVFSYPGSENGHLNLPCSLITHYPCYKPIVLNEDSPALSFISQEESYCLPLCPHEAHSANTLFLANQAKCPFKAFASHRLHAKASLPNIDGLSPGLRGQILHKVMELLWQEIPSQDALLKLSESSKDLLIDTAIKTSLSLFNQTLRGPAKALIENIEYQRIKHIVLLSLHWEKKRPPFKISALEQTYSLRLANLNFEVRIDRLDEVGENKWVIDYKSTLPSKKPWNEDRPEEPQLLLYTLLDEQINTLLFIQLKTGSFICSGLSEENHDIEGIKSLKKEENWSSHTTRWQEQLTQLAKEYQQGHCPPQPVNVSVCQQCDFKALCRFQHD